MNSFASFGERICRGVTCFSVFRVPDDHGKRGADSLELEHWQALAISI